MEKRSEESDERIRAETDDRKDELNLEIVYERVKHC